MQLRRVVVGDGEELVDAADEEAALLVGVAEERELGAEERLPEAGDDECISLSERACASL